MRPHRTFPVVPRLPESLTRLGELAGNLRFSWDHATVDLFRMIDRDLWEQCGRNPVLFLGSVPQCRLEECGTDDAILANLEKVWRDHSRYLASDRTWFTKSERPDSPARIGYFSAEFGLASCVPIYSGGLGILAGDHLKSASDLGLPLTGVGLFYQRGYFRQYLNSEGWQQENYPANDFHNLPVRPAQSATGGELRIELDLHGRTLNVAVWEMKIGRVPLILLDTNLSTNDPDFRAITSDLYGGGADLRLLQEFVLGVGGLRALAALGRTPDVCHMNEGHSAFLALERIRVLMEEGLSFAEARVAASASMVFTTHTPVPDAIDLFSTEQMESVFGEWRGALGLSSEELMDLGREHPGASGAPFNMAVFALRMASHANGVSALHGKVSRGMWNFLWPGLPEEDVPIGSVTNGIHSQTWVSREMRELFDRHLGPRWCRDPEDRTIWDGVDRIPDEILWRTREVQRQRLVSVVRSRLRERLVAANATPVEVAAAEGVLDPSALTIGFARRFAPYKRADLLLADPDRLRAILTNPDRPVQFVFAGKAHPRNDAGKKLIQEIVRFSRLPEVRGRVVFVEDYDMDVAARLVQGVDVWMNTPRRPLEASGTSGMKASINGVLNMSVLDGWWDEAAGERLGWSIGNGEVYDDSTTQDSIESGAIYDLLENEIAPLFYERSRDGIPEQWIGMMKETIRGICPEFNTNRMVREYAEQYYFPVADRSARLASNGNGATRELAAWMERVASVWDAVEIREIRTGDPAGLTVGSTVGVRARVALGGLSESDLLVQIYHGAVDAQGELAGAEGVRMIMDGTLEAGEAWFSGEVPCPVTGQRGFAVRVLPRHADLPHPFLPGLIRWDSDPPRGSREAAGAITR